MRHIVVAIEPHEDGRCGECGKQVCRYKIRIEQEGKWPGEWTRGPACLAAEAKLTALIESGMVLARRNDDEYVEEWDRAVAEVRR